MRISPHLAPDARTGWIALAEYSGRWVLFVITPGHILVRIAFADDVDPDDVSAVAAWVGAREGWLFHTCRSSGETVLVHDDGAGPWAVSMSVPPDSSPELTALAQRVLDETGWTGEQVGGLLPLLYSVAAHSWPETAANIHAAATAAGVDLADLDTLDARVTS